MPRSFPGLGSVSEGTLRTDDLLSAFAWTLKYHGGRKGKALACEYDQLPAADDWTEEQTEQAEYLLEEMFTALDELAPDYVHFGTAEGDGADFGYWPSIDSLEDDVRAGEVCKVADLLEIPANWRGYVMEVNDHGNVTLYWRNGNRTLREIWSCV